MNQTLLNQELFSFIKESPTNYHAITAASRLLADQGFTPLSEQDAWTLLPGGKYYVSRGETSLFAFRMPEKLTAAPLTFQIVASHSDSPCFKLKKKAEMTVDGHYTKLNVERYGGSISLSLVRSSSLHCRTSDPENRTGNEKSS